MRKVLVLLGIVGVVAAIVIVKRRGATNEQPDAAGVEAFDATDG